MEAPRTQKSVSERKELPQSLHQPGTPWRDPRCSATTLRSCLCGSRSGLPSAGWLTRQAGCECSASNSCVLILLNMHRLPNSAFSKLASPARTPLPRLPCSLPARKAIAPLLAGVPSAFLQGFGLRFSYLQLFPSYHPRKGISDIKTGDKLPPLPGTTPPPPPNTLV